MKIQPSTKAEERWRLLNLRWLPARVQAEEAGWLLGFNLDEMRVLIGKGLLKPLGNPSQNGRKCFSTVKIQELGNNPEWLEKASKVLVQHWRNRNSPKVST